jgi:predicted  nucleic acid-binding Zn-ribbon protein
MNRRDLKKLKSLLKDMDELAEKLQHTASEAEEVAQELKGLVEPTSILFPERDLRMLGDMSRDIRSFRFVPKIRRHLPDLEDQVSRRERDEDDLSELLDDIQNI